MTMTMTALRWFSSSYHTGHTGRVAGHVQKDMEQDSKVVLWVLMDMVVYSTQAARFSPLTFGLPSSLKS